MKTRRVLWMVICGILALLYGCAGGDDDADTDELTVANLQGTYDLDVSESPLGDLTDDGAEVRSGVLEADATSAIFTIIAVTTESFDIVGTETLTLTEADGDTVDFQAHLTDNGSTLSLMDMGTGETLIFLRRSTGLGTELTVANLQGEYDLDVANSSRVELEDNFVITAAGLSMTNTTVILTATATLAGTYSIVDQETVRITVAAGERIDLTTTLSDNRTRLRLVDDDDNVYLFDKR